MKINNNLNINALFNQKGHSPEVSKVIKETIQADDNLIISNDGKNLHALAVKSNEIMNSIDNIRQDELKSIKKKLEDGYYQRNEVINQVASSIMEEDEFQELFLNEETLGTIKEYIDVRESDIEKVNNSKAKVDRNAYNKDDVYQMVADEIIDIYT